MSLFAFLIPESASLDRIKVMKMALLHDLGESIVGDITPYCGIDKEEKKMREHKAMLEISGLVGSSGDEMLQLFEEYEQQISAEAQFVKDCDRYDMILQAFEYEQRDCTPGKHQEFFDSTKDKFLHPMIIEMVEILYKRRDEYQDNYFKDLKQKNQSNAS